MTHATEDRASIIALRVTLAVVLLTGLVIAFRLAMWAVDGARDVTAGLGL